MLRKTSGLTPTVRRVPNQRAAGYQTSGLTPTVRRDNRSSRVYHFDSSVKTSRVVTRCVSRYTLGTYWLMAKENLPGYLESLD